MALEVLTMIKIVVLNEKSSRNGREIRAALDNMGKVVSQTTHTIFPGETSNRVESTSFSLPDGECNNDSGYSAHLLVQIQYKLASEDSVNDLHFTKVPLDISFNGKASGLGSEIARVPTPVQIYKSAFASQFAS